MRFQTKILLIEDDPNLGAALQNILTFAHYDVCHALNGASGIQKAFQYNPDLILCDINMQPIDGYQVYSVLEESSILSRVPFIFLTGSSDLVDVRHGLALGADDYLVKPVKNEELIHTIEKRLEKFSAIKNEAAKGLDRLFDLSPAEMILFDGKKLFKANEAFKKLSKIGDLKRELTLSHIIDSESIQKLENNIENLQDDKKEKFNELVKLKIPEQDDILVKLVVVEFEKFSNYTLYLGIFTTNAENHNQTGSNGYANEIYKLLRRENIRISEALGEKITELFKNHKKTIPNSRDSIFTIRENQVLNLSMEGLPIKVIAERLNISDRTVEKYRTKLMEKTDSSNMIEVIVFALKNNLIEI